MGDFNLKSKFGSALQFAIEKNATKIIKLLLESGANANESPQTWRRTTYLHLAICNDTILKFLIQHGANINARNWKGYTALHIASKQNLMKSVKLLVQNEANPNMDTFTGNYDALQLAYQVKNYDIVKILI